MSTKLYVGNLPYSVTSDELNNIFSAVGKVVSAQVITFADSGRSKGFGFVEMATEEDAQNAIDSLNDTDVGGRKIRVDIARPMQKKSFNRRKRF